MRFIGFHNQSEENYAIKVLKGVHRFLQREAAPGTDMFNPASLMLRAMRVANHRSFGGVESRLSEMKEESEWNLNLNLVTANALLAYVYSVDIEQVHPLDKRGLMILGFANAIGAANAVRTAMHQYALVPDIFETGIEGFTTDVMDQILVDPSTSSDLDDLDKEYMLG